MAFVDILAIEPNVPKANLEDYIYLLYGRPKVGKTTFFRDLVRYAFPNNPRAGLLFAFEEGFKALAGILAQPIDEWEDFLEAIEQLIDNREQVPFKLLAFDTVDRMYAMCTIYILKKQGLKDGTMYKTPTDIPWGKGHQMIAGEMEEQISRLQKAGYGLFFITHDQDKKFESREGASYDKTTVSLDKRARDIVVNMADFIVFIENSVKKGKGDKVVSERVVYLRADGTDIEAGSRFTHIKERIGYDPAEFVEAFEEAVLASFEQPVDIEKVKSEQAQERSEKAQEFADADKAVRNLPTAEELIESIGKRVKEISPDGRKKFKVLSKEIVGTENFKRVDDVEKLTELFEAMTDLS